MLGQCFSLTEREEDGKQKNGMQKTVNMQKFVTRKNKMEKIHA